MPKKGIARREAVFNVTLISSNMIKYLRSKIARDITILINAAVIRA